MNNINERLVELTKRLVDPRYRDSLDHASLLLEDKILDSFGLLRLVVEIENEFSFSIKNEDLTPLNFAAITNIGALVERYIANGQ